MPLKQGFFGACTPGGRERYPGAAPCAATQRTITPSYNWPVLQAFNLASRGSNPLGVTTTLRVAERTMHRPPKAAKRGLTPLAEAISAHRIMERPSVYETESEGSTPSAPTI